MRAIKVQTLVERDASLFLCRNRNTELFADLPHEMGIDLTMAWHRAAEIPGRIQDAGMIAAFANNSASMSFQMSEQLFSFHPTAPAWARM